MYCERILMEGVHDQRIGTRCTSVQRGEELQNMVCFSTGTRVMVLTVFLLASLAAGKCVCRLACALLHSCVFHISCYKYMLAQCERGEGRRRRCKERGEEEV